MGREVKVRTREQTSKPSSSGRNDDSFAIRSSAPVQQNLGAAQSFTANASNGNVNLEFVQ